MPSIIVPSTDALKEPTVLRALRKLTDWCTGNFQKIADNQDVIAIDTSMSASSTNPVQNKVISSKLTEMETSFTNNLNNKLDNSEYYRKIYFGNDETPSPDFGENGDVYIYIPN